MFGFSLNFLKNVFLWNRSTEISYNKKTKRARLSSDHEDRTNFLKVSTEAFSVLAEPTERKTDCKSISTMTEIFDFYWNHPEEGLNSGKNCPGPSTTRIMTATPKVGSQRKKSRRHLSSPRQKRRGISLKVWREKRKKFKTGFRDTSTNTESGFPTDIWDSSTEGLGQTSTMNTSAAVIKNDLTESNITEVLDTPVNNEAIPTLADPIWKFSTLDPISDTLTNDEPTLFLTCAPHLSWNARMAGDQLSVPLRRNEAYEPDTVGNRSEVIKTAGLIEPENWTSTVIDLTYDGCTKRKKHRYLSSPRKKRRET